MIPLRLLARSSNLAAGETKLPRCARDDRVAPELDSAGCGDHFVGRLFHGVAHYEVET
jgi:hypothetical protein